MVIDGSFIVIDGSFIVIDGSFMIIDGSFMVIDFFPKALKNISGEYFRLTVMSEFLYINLVL
jgi:hypothetical protein